LNDSATVPLTVTRPFFMLSVIRRREPIPASVSTFISGFEVIWLKNSLHQVYMFDEKSASALVAYD
jgi:hypothetical protein